MSEQHTDDDAPDIPPALTASEWSERATDPVKRDGVLIGLTDIGLFVQDGGIGDESVAIGSDVTTLAALIALANAAMHDEDPRKIRREHMELLRWIANERESALIDGSERDRFAELHDLADALESLLPPAND